MEKEQTSEVTESSEKNSGDQALDLDGLIQQQLEGKEEDESDSTPVDAGDASEEAGETEQTPEEPKAPESENVEAPEEGAPEEPAWFEKRLGKEVRRRKEALEEVESVRDERDSFKEEIEQLKEQLGKAQQQPESPNPLNKVDSLEKLEQERRLSHNRLDFADSVEEVLDEGNIDEALKLLEAQDVKFDANREEYGWEEQTAKEAKRFLKKLRSHSRKTLDKHIPERGNFLHDQKLFNDEAKKLYPELLKQDSEFSKVFAEVSTGPAGVFFEGMPDGAWQMARWVRGYMAEMSDGKKSQKKTSKAPPTSIPKPSSAPVTGDKDEAEYRSARDRVMEKGDADSLDNYLGTLLTQ